MNYLKTTKTTALKTTRSLWKSNGPNVSAQIQQFLTYDMTAVHLLPCFFYSILMVVAKALNCSMIYLRCECDNLVKKKHTQQNICVRDKGLMRTNARSAHFRITVCGVKSLFTVTRLNVLYLVQGARGKNNKNNKFCHCFAALSWIRMRNTQFLLFVWF